MKKKIEIILVIVVTIACIFSGINVRKANAISVTQIKTNSNESLSYMLETKENQIIMIDGGNYDDAEELEKILQEKGGIVNSWFITMGQVQNFGAMQQIIKNGNIEIDNIYISFNDEEWYEENAIEGYNQVSELIELLSEKEMIDKTFNISEKTELLIDNLYVSILNVKNPELTGENAIYNQSMVIKVNNTYKSMIFMGSISNEVAYKFKDDNLDQIDCDAVQVSNNNIQEVNDEIYQLMTPQYLFISASDEGKNIANEYIQRLKSLLKSQETYISADGNKTVEIW